MTQVEYGLTEELDKRLQTLMDGMSRGTPVDYSEYCKLVGEIRGIRYCLTVLAQLIASITEGDEE